MNRRITFAEIIAHTSEVFDVPVAVMKGPSRCRVHVRPRFAACWLGYELTALSYPQMGYYLGGRDHSTIIHAINTTPELMERDEVFRRRIERIRLRVVHGIYAEVDDILIRQRIEAAEKRKAEALAATLREKKAAEAREQLAAMFAITQEPDDDMELLSRAVQAHRAKGGDFIEVWS